MKKILLVATVIALCGIFQNAKAQFSLGAGLNYATEIGTLGISAQAAYDFTEQWAATGAFTYYFEKDNVTWTNIDLNANYTFTEIENIGKLYGIAGFSHLTASVDIPKYIEGNITYGGGSISESKTGVNLGAGLKMDLSEKMLLCPELMYTSTGSGHIRIGAKLMFKL